MSKKAMRTWRFVSERQYRRWVKDAPYMCANFAAPGERCFLNHLHRGPHKTMAEAVAESAAIIDAIKDETP